MPVSSLMLRYVTLSTPPARHRRRCLLLSNADILANAGNVHKDEVERQRSRCAIAGLAGCRNARASAAGSVYMSGCMHCQAFLMSLTWCKSFSRSGPVHDVSGTSGFGGSA